MSLILIVIYCLTAVLFLFGLTFHDELLKEKQRKRRHLGSLTVIDGGRSRLARTHRHM